MKDPAFLFYPNDFLSGTMFFSNECVGIYIRILLAQHQHGHLTKKQMEILCNCEIPEEILAKFSQDSEGKYYNERLENEIIKRQKHSEKQRQNATMRWHKSGIGLAMPLENVNENENRNKDKIRFNLKDKLLKEGYELNLIEEWIKIRKNKKATNTETALKKFLEEVKKSGIDKNEILKMCVEKSWAGFNHKWLQEEKKELKKNSLEYILKSSEEELEMLKRTHENK